MTDIHAEPLDRLIVLTRSVASGDRRQVEDLMAMAGDGRLPPKMAELAEAVGMLVVQVEAREFHLSCTIAELERTQAELENANYDPLTGLPNRAIFQDRLRKAVNGAGSASQAMALMFVDLDRFKHVNDSLGHDAGDQLLRVVAARIKSCVRTDDIVARLGGDEFTVILGSIHGQEEAAEVAARIIGSVGEPVHLAAGTAHVGASVGIALLPLHADTAEDLLQHADRAMYQAKEAGRNKYCIYTPALADWPNGPA